MTVNSLLPGGATDTGMAPKNIALELRRHLLDPEVMVPPILWLVSEEAGAVTGARLVAKFWDSSLVPTRAAEKARFMAGWTIPEP